MSMRYSRSVPIDAPPGALEEARAEVRAHLSAVADTDDDPNTHADDVRVWTEDDDGATKVVGELDAEPNAPYLRDDFDPKADTEFEFQPWFPEEVER